MTSSPRSSRPRFRRRRRIAGGLWRWLGLGALGLAGATLLRGERREARQLRSREQQPENEPSGSLAFEPPPDAEASWIAGPAGNLRVIERHREAALPILFVHGLGGRAEQWSGQLAAAGPAIHAIALDLPGHGRSDGAHDDDYSIAALAAAIGAVADGLGLRRMLLVAHSLGASAAAEYAASHPRRVSGLLLVDPGGDQTRLPEAQRRQFLDQLRRSPEEELAWYFRQILSGTRPEVADRVLEQLATVPVEVTLAALESAAFHSPAAALERYGGPILSVISDLNTLPYSLHNLLPGISMEHLEGVGHWLMMDRPDELWAVLVGFLDELVEKSGNDLLAQS